MPIPWWAQVVVVLALAFAAYRAGVLDRAGAALAAAFGLLILASAGVGFLALLALFTMAGFGVTRIGYERKARQRVNEPGRGRRGWRNVLANGATATAVAGAAVWLPPEVVALPFAAAVAAAAADTFGSELGSLGRRAVLLTRPREVVPPGTNGGVSWPGTVASVAGAALVALLAHLVTPLAWGHVPVVVLAGFAGSLLDSLLGATWESSPPHHDGPLSKADVNFISITAPTAVLFLLAGLGWV